MGEHQFREDGSHYNGGAEFFGYGYAAIGEPRLKMIRRWYRQGVKRGVSDDRFFVDGQQVKDYAEAVEKLKTPPVLTGGERSMLALFGDEPIKRPVGDIEAIFNLRAKGFVHAADGLYTITDAGRAALANGGE